MRKTDLDSWKIVRKEPDKPYLTYSIFESNNSEYAFYYSQIEEWSIMKYCSKFEIYRDKSSPTLIFQNSDAWFLYDVYDESRFIYDWTSKQMVCLRQLINKGKNKYIYPFIIFNLVSNEYSVIEDQSLISLKLRDGTSIIGIKAELDKTSNNTKEIEIIYSLNELKWESITQFN